jgi:hypothetical protein
MTPAEFLFDEGGAVTSDWAVLSAAILGIGMATVAVTSVGLEDLSGDIATALTERIEDGFEAATAGLTVTALWDDPAAAPRDLANVQRFSFATVVDFTADSDGIIFETGGGAWGTVLYQHDGVLYLQAGRGNGYGAATDRGEASWSIEEGTATIEGSLDADGGLALIVNGETVSQSSFDAPRLAGGNAGSIAGTDSGVAANRGGFDRRHPGHPGVAQVAIFEDQTTGDERPPSD